jgi:nicotinamide mononucleotide transporter
MDPLEIAANAVMAVSIWLAARNSIYTWPTGVVGCALFVFVFFDARLYAVVTLQLFFIATSFLGWWQWLHAGHETAAQPASGFPGEAPRFDCHGGTCTDVCP